MSARCTIRQYAHGLKIESPFVHLYHLVPIAGLYGKNKAKTALSVAVEAKPELTAHYLGNAEEWELLGGRLICSDGGDSAKSKSRSGRRRHGNH